MTRTKAAVTPLTVRELRDLAEWASSNISGSGALVGQKEFRRRWSRYGVQNTLAVLDLWQEAWQQQQQARAELADAEAELRRLRELKARHPSRPSDDPGAFPVLRRQRQEAEARMGLLQRQLEQAREQEATALADGQERLSHLTAQVASRQRELENLQETIEAERRDLAELRSDTKEQGDVRDRLQRLVTAMAAQLGS
jgi:DNA repair exonuclease SbcCD ATPase subunit